LFGVAFYSIVKKIWGMLTLFSPALIYRLVTDAKNNKESEALLKKRNLK